MTSTQWQLTHDSAARYEAILVPAILGPFARALVDWADLAPATTIVDVGCGTGAAARFAALKVGPQDRIIGCDVNPAMLRVAHSLPSNGAPIEWRHEPAEALSLDDASVDGVLCAQSLQFVGDPLQALNEMRRIVKQGRAAYLSLWCPIEQNPYFDALVNTMAEQVGEDTATGLRSAFSLSQIEPIRVLLATAGFTDMAVTTAELVLELPPVADFVPRHIQATPMWAGYNAAAPMTQQALLAQLTDQLAAYRSPVGLAMPFRSYLIRAVK